ncbi:hypothetical protein OUZ56_031809 [Daphnia magna]|uniref:Uncharacterized protein n=1 Tax=Daphnia magna TaxID=35525 RepID=A0ABQ9ZVD9_9CRUS|nr:hypothetical protein OUZ56_031809 [Daphnia magna]
MHVGCGTSTIGNGGTATPVDDCPVHTPPAVASERTSNGRLDQVMRVLKVGKTMREKGGGATAGTTYTKMKQTGAKAEKDRRKN